MKWIEIGFLLIFIGIFFTIIGALTQPDSKSKVAVGGFIGPIPFGFANDKTMLFIVIALSIILFIFWLMIKFWK